MTQPNRANADSDLDMLEKLAIEDRASGAMYSPTDPETLVDLIRRLRLAESGWDALHVASNEAIDKLESRVILLERVRTAAAHVLDCPDPGENRASTLEADARWQDEWMARSQAEEGLQFALDALEAK